MRHPRVALLPVVCLFSIFGCQGPNTVQNPGSQGTVEAPTFGLASGYYGSSQSVTIQSETSGAEIRYTTDGSTPTESVGSVYTGAVPVAITKTLKAIAFKENYTSSTVASSTYYIQIAALDATIRDFYKTQTDFEQSIGSDLGIVLPNLGSDHKPVYGNHPSGTATTSSSVNFNLWYNDIGASTNTTIAKTLPVAEVTAGQYQYSNASFFPIDGEGFGNDGNAHNFHFTMEIHAGLYYDGIGSITITGANDYWIFVNGKLAIDGGGVHGASSGSVTLDAAAGTAFGLSSGSTYHVDIFWAQRHTTASVFTVVADAKLISLAY